MSMSNDYIVNNNTIIFSKNDKNIILVRSILSSVSYCCCLFLMIIYLILCLQVKLKICIKKEEEKNSGTLIENDYATNSSDKNDAQKKRNKIGLGPNYIFLLTISNFFASLFEFLFYFLYVNRISYINNPIDLYNEMNNDGLCILLGFAHNFFDLFAVCWTTMLTLLFYRSTNLSHEMLYNDNKYLMIGFVYSIFCSLIFCGFPMVTKSYGFARYYCSFKYDEFDQEGNYLGESISSKCWRYSFAVVTFFNNIANVIWLLKTTTFYSKKLKLIQKQNKTEYKNLLKYVWIFRIFPIALMFSRISKGLSRFIKDTFKPSENFETILEYINAFFFASTGIFDSIACTFFFSGVFWCCRDKNRTQSISTINKDSSDMNIMDNDNTEESS